MYDERRSEGRRGKAGVMGAREGRKGQGAVSGEVHPMPGGQELLSDGCGMKLADLWRLPWPGTMPEPGNRIWETQKSFTRAVHPPLAGAERAPPYLTPSKISSPLLPVRAPLGRAAQPRSVRGIGPAPLTMRTKRGGFGSQPGSRGNRPALGGPLGLAINAPSPRTIPHRKTRDGIYVASPSGACS
jgi:hypothetical protein